MQRIIIALIVITAALAQKAAAQIVNVGDHYGLLDNTTHRVLVATSQPDDNALPATFEHQGSTYDVCTTTLPLVLLEHDVLVSEAFRQGHLTLIDPEAPDGTAPFSCPVELRYRGATALGYDKKSYAVKLLNPATADAPAGPESLDASLLGLRTDNSWILDAMASDLARMRNRVSMDFWLDFSARPYYAETIEPKMVNGTRGKFVEVFIADRYWGLYCLSEKVDRKQLKLKKYASPTQPRGLLYKSVAYDNLLKITDPNPDNNSSTWQGWEAAYPDVRKGEPFDWRPLFDAATLFATYPGGDDFFQQNLRHMADLPVWCDYELFCELLMADDNACKNQYLYYRDVTASPAEPLCICPWDLDATWGQDWLHRHIASNLDCTVAPAVLYHFYFTQPLDGLTFQSRWHELRKTYFDADVIRRYFRRYFDLFATSGADRRETERWDGANGVSLDFQAEDAYISRWVEERIHFLDGQYEYDPQGIAHIVTDAPAPMPVYTLSGTIAAYCSSPAAVHHAGLTPGLYIVNGRKVIVR